MTASSTAPIWTRSARWCVPAAIARAKSGGAAIQAMPVQPGNVGGADPKEQLGRMFLRDSAEPSEPPAPDAFLSK